MKPEPKPVYRIKENIADQRFPYMVIGPDDTAEHVDVTPERCSVWAFSEHGDGIEVRHDYLEGR